MDVCGNQYRNDKILKYYLKVKLKVLAKNTTLSGFNELRCLEIMCPAELNTRSAGTM